jgi:SAM-dependent methyltransferase
MLSFARQLVHINFPFTYVQICIRQLPARAKSILDIGCGQGDTTKAVPRSMLKVGIDLYPGYLRTCSRNRALDPILADIRFLPIKPAAFDVVLCLHAVEHVEKADGKRLLRFLEKAATQAVIISTPVGFHPDRHGECNNEFEKYLHLHKSFWDPREFQTRGFKVYGYTLHLPLRDRILNSRFKFLKLVYEISASFLSPLVYFSPRNANFMVCVRNMGPR